MSFFNLFRSKPDIFQLNNKLLFNPSVYFKDEDTINKVKILDERDINNFKNMIDCINGQITTHYGFVKSCNLKKFNKKNEDFFFYSCMEYLFLVSHILHININHRKNDFSMKVEKKPHSFDQRKKRVNYIEPPFIKPVFLTLLRGTISHLIDENFNNFKSVFIKFFMIRLKFYLKYQNSLHVLFTEFESQSLYEEFFSFMIEYPCQLSNEEIKGYYIQNLPEDVISHQVNIKVFEDYIDNSIRNLNSLFGSGYCLGDDDGLKRIPKWER